ncbi:MAG: GTPase [archaeon]|nr:GTPase [archaeon]
MSTNQGPEYFAAEKDYFKAKTIDEKIIALGEMIRNLKKHKGSENMLAELRTRLKKLIEKKAKAKKVGKSTFKSIKKEGYQAVLIGLPNSGKSCLLSKLTNAKPKISEHPFTTFSPELGTMYYQGAKVQIVDLPSIGNESFDIGIVNTADTLILVVEKLEDKDKIEPLLNKTYGKKIIVINKADTLSSEEIRKLEEKIKSKKFPAILVSCITGLNLEKLKEAIFKNMDSIRVYTKEPGKIPAKMPVVLPKNSTIRDVAESILKGFSNKVRETHITGPSSKFPNQRVGLNHRLKDLDIVEFHTR